jgi:hypothetical protein
MGLTLAMWLCTLPLIAFVIAPLFGGRIAVSVAIGFLIVMLVFCWLSCLPKAVQTYRDKQRHSEISNLKRESSNHE